MQLNSGLTGASMDEQDASLYIVDDDPAVVRSIERLLRSENYVVETFLSAQEFLDKARVTQKPACVVLDIQMPGLSGLELQAELQKLQASLSIIFITGHGDIPMTVQAMKAGAIEFLTKPFDVQVLLDAIRRGLERSQAILGVEQKLQSLRALLRTLTPRERDVMSLITTGLLNKQVAGMLGISEITVKAHRGKAMRKMKARSFADLVRMAGDLALVGSVR